MRSQKAEVRSQKAEARSPLRRTRCSVLSLGAVVLMLSGCSYNVPSDSEMKMGSSAEKGPPLRQLVQGHLEALANLDAALANVNTAADAQAAAPQVKDLYEKLRQAVIAEKAVRSHSMPEEEKQVDGQFRSNIASRESSIDLKIDDVKGRFPAAQDFIKAATDGKDSVEAVKDAKDPNATTDIHATQPQGSTWLMWILILLVMGACTASCFKTASGATASG